MTKRIQLVVTCVLLTVAPALRADFTSTLAGNTATMTGDAAADVLVITASGGLLQHGRATAGDAGFTSDSDWDTTVAGDQTLAAADPSTANIDLGAGDDSVQIGDGVLPASTTFAAINLVNAIGLAINDTGHTGNSYAITFADIDAPGLDVSFSGPGFGFILIELSPGVDNILFNNVQAGEVWSIYTGAGNDAITVNGSGQDLDGIQGTLSLDGGPDTDTLEVLDAGDGDANVYDISPASLARTGMLPISFTTFETLTLRTTNGTNVVNTEPLVGVAQILEGNDPAVAPGDVLNYDSLGICATDSGTVITSPLGGNVSYSEFETVNVAGCAPAGIPTLGEVGFGALALALGMLALLRMRSRRVLAS